MQTNQRSETKGKETHTHTHSCRMRWQTKYRRNKIPRTEYEDNNVLHTSFRCDIIALTRTQMHWNHKSSLRTQTHAHTSDSNRKRRQQRIRKETFAAAFWAIASAHVPRYCAPRISCSYCGRRHRLGRGSSVVGTYCRGRRRRHSQTILFISPLFFSVLFTLDSYLPHVSLPLPPILHCGKSLNK